VTKRELGTTTILCTDTATHPRHHVVIYDDGTAACDCGEAAIEQARLLGAAVKLGRANLVRRSCTGLIAFATVGLPHLVASRASERGEWGAWKPAWDAYCTNALVHQVYVDLVHKRDAEHAETLKVARRALVSCGRYRDGMSKRDFADEVCFVPNSEVKVGDFVALYASDAWKVPLQADWLESVGKAKPVIDGRFVVGVNVAHPGFVYAIDGTNDSGFEVCEFAVVNGKLGKVARPK
jgi:hypothetical protein